MWDDGSFEVRSFDPGSWRFDFREQTITYARVAAHIGERQAVAFAYSQDSLRAACKVSSPVAFVSTSEKSAHVKPAEAKVIAGKKSRIKSTGSPNKQYRTDASPIRASVVSRQQSAHVTQSDVQPVFVSRTRVH